MTSHAEVLCEIKNKNDPLDRSFTEADHVLGYESTIQELDTCINTMAPGHVSNKEVLEDKDIPLTLDSPVVASSPARKGEKDSKDKVNFLL